MRYTQELITICIFYSKAKEDTQTLFLLIILTCKNQYHMQNLKIQRDYVNPFIDRTFVCAVFHEIRHLIVLI